MHHTWPLNPLARKNPGIQGASPRIGWWSASFHKAQPRRAWDSPRGFRIPALRSAARVRIFSTNARSKSVLYPGVSFGSFQAEKKAASLGTKMKSIRHIDDHRSSVRKLVKRLTGHQHPAQRLNRQFTPNQPRHSRSPCTSAVHNALRVSTGPRGSFTDAMPAPSLTRPCHSCVLPNRAPRSQATR